VPCMKHIYFVFLTVLFGMSTKSANHISAPSPDISSCIIENASYFIGTLYVANTLESSDNEKLIIYNDRYDCVTFVEYILALSIYQNQPSESQKTLPQIITQIRYRNGKLDGYGSRLHYFTEWMIHNEQYGIIKNITPEIGGKPFDKKIHFMTTYKSKYPKLNNAKDLQKIKDAEIFLQTQKLTYMPKDKVRSAFTQINNGDIIAITTGIDGLDIVHTGFAYRKGNDIHLLHASEKEGKVVISDLPIDQYMLKNKSQSGIMVARVM
jgi:Protein of unknown function (DUF1460)